jgi:hypothetical protein
MHVGKPSGGSQRTPLQQLLGATAFGALARLVSMVVLVPGRDDNDDGESKPVEPRRLFGVVKSNLGIKPRSLEWSRPLDGPIQWHGESEHDLD